MIELAEDDLRARLRAGTLSGLEPARGPGASDWRPLHALPLFADALPVRGDPARLAHHRAVRRWSTHVVIFSGVCFALWRGAGHFPVCGLYWLIPLSLHTLRTLPSLLELLRPTPAPAIRPEEELDRLILSLNAATSTIDALEAEAQTLEARLATETSQRAAVELEQQFSALNDRIALMAEARVALVRLEALRARLVHEAASLELTELQDAAVSLARLRDSISPTE